MELGYTNRTRRHLRLPNHKFAFPGQPSLDGSRSHLPRAKLAVAVAGAGESVFYLDQTTLAGWMRPASQPRCTGRSDLPARVCNIGLHRVASGAALLHCISSV